MVTATVLLLVAFLQEVFCGGTYPPNLSPSQIPLELVQKDRRCDQLTIQLLLCAGQFFHPFDYKVFELHPGSDPTKTDATMVVKNQRLTVTRGLQKDYSKDPRHGAQVTCWFVHNNGASLIDGVHTDYVVPAIF